MRILQLRFKNLNSLIGEWEIDLSHPAFAADGIFAITGPTGAGKTTILDAICLALYGRTPRLSKVTKSSNEIMSRHCGECFAEITFETPAGQFRCHWSQHRARKKSDGDLQLPKHEIVDALSGKVLEAKIRNVAECIENVTGMDFERFTLSMLLAQGGFAAFLQAPADQRAPILEQITGTAIYSHISTRVHELRAGERKKLDTLRAELTGMTLLSSADEQQIRDNLGQQSDKESELNQQREQHSIAIAWLQNIEVLEQDLQLIDQQQQALTERQAAFNPAAEKLERANRALGLAADYASLSALRREQVAERRQQEECHLALQATNQAVKNAQNNLQVGDEELLKRQIEQQQALSIIREVRALDLKQREKQAPIDNVQQAIAEREKASNSLQDQHQNDCRSLENNKAECTKVLEQLAKNPADEGLVEQLSGLQNRFAAIAELDAQHQLKFKQLEQARRHSSEALAEWRQQDAQLGAQTKALASWQSKFDALQSERLKTLSGHELAHWRSTLASLNERKALLDKLESLVQAIAESRILLGELTHRETVLSTDHTNISRQAAEHREKQSALEREMQLLETQLVLLNKIHSFEQAREQLSDGEACPLCGSEDHPFAEGNSPSPDASTQRLNAVRSELKAANDGLYANKVKQAENAKDQQQVLQRKSEADLQIKQQEGEFQGLQAQLTGDKVDAQNKEISADLPQLKQSNAAALQSTVATIESLEQQEKALLILRNSVEQANRATALAQRSTQSALHHKDSAEQAIARLGEEFSQTTRQVEQSRNSLLRDLANYGITQLATEQLQQVEQDLRRRREQWLNLQQNKAQLERGIASLTMQTQQQSKQLIQQGTELEKQREIFARLVAQRDALSRERTELFADKNPDSEETRLNAAIALAEKQRDASRHALNLTSQESAKFNSRIEALADALLARETQLKTAENRFQARLGESVFLDENYFQAACISDNELQQLIVQAEALSTEKSGLQARQTEKTERLNSARQQHISEQSIGPLKNQLEQLLGQLKLIQQEMGGIKHKLSANENLRNKQQSRVAAIEAQQGECRRWDSLHELIGSADGKKYRNFAQGLTFELMVGHANRQLQKMSDRYLLVRDVEQPLELNVVDNYQAGEIRSTKNLSGGESFIVSLALALGLSQMASKNVRVDSLFLDEGFGTLDEDALDTALAALSSLQQSGKLIGVISHVASLKERIPSQIKVSPQSGGRSLLSGPGCRRLN